jgi:hypothetical protein
MSERRETYRTAIDTLLQRPDNNDMIDARQPCAGVPDLQEAERMLIPLLNWVRRAQGKKPVIVPKG